MFVAFVDNGRGMMEEEERMLIEALRLSLEEQQRTKKTTNAVELDRLPVYAFSKRRAELMASCVESCSCAVCKCDFEVEELLMHLPCQHIFHKACIIPWLKENNTCPVCRYELMLEDPQLEQDRKQRMSAKFDKISLSLIEISRDIEKAFSDLCNKKSTPRRIDAFLLQKLIELDGIEPKEIKQKEERRRLITKIQNIHHMIDKQLEF